jgi:hypothetical protein
VKVCLILSAHGLEVAADGPQLHGGVLRPRDQVIVMAIDSRITVSPSVNNNELWDANYIFTLEWIAFKISYKYPNSRTMSVCP